MPECTFSEIPQRVLLYSGSYNHIVDGVTLTLNRLVEHLESKGIEVLVVAPTTHDPQIEHYGTLATVPSIPAPGRKEYRISTIIPPALRSRIIDFDPDVVHIATPDLLGRWTMSYARRKGIPVVTTYHTDFSSYLRYYRLEFLESFLIGYLRYFYRRCDLVCVPSQSMIQELSSRGIEGDMRIWARGVETDRFSPHRRSMQWRRNRGVPDDVPLITYVGRLVHEKNVSLLADLSDILKSRDISHKVLLVGDGPAREDLAVRMPDALFAGHTTGGQLTSAYASSDIFFFPSVTETFGNVVLEAMSSGLPTVCAQATGSSDLVRHGETGFLLPPADLATMVDHVERLSSDPVLRESMGANARARAEEYRWDRVLDRMIGYYSETMSQPPQPASGLSRLMCTDRAQRIHSTA